MSSGVDTNYGGFPTGYRPQLSQESLNQARKEIDEAYQEKFDAIDRHSASTSARQEVEKTQLQANLHLQDMQLEANKTQFSEGLHAQSLASQEKDREFSQQLQSREAERAKMLEDKKTLLEQRKQELANTSPSQGFVGSPEQSLSQTGLDPRHQTVQPIAQQSFGALPQQSLPNFNSGQIDPRQVHQMQQQAQNMQQQMKQNQTEKKSECVIS